MRPSLLFSLVIGLLLSAGPVDARINPSLLKRSQDYAAEKLVVKVLKVTVVKKGLSSHVTAKAKVTLVRESRSGLKRGDRITISYTSRRLPRGASGPMPIRILSKGSVGAFLYGSKGVYSPAARAFSFISARNMRKRKLKPRPVRRIKRRVVKRRGTLVRPAKTVKTKTVKVKTVKVKNPKTKTVKVKTVKTKTVKTKTVKVKNPKTKTVKRTTVKTKTVKTKRR